ncbi:MAG: thymidine phosphorylase [candidate division WOR-3 bacterium]
MDFLSLLQRKKAGARLTDSEIDWLIRSYTKNEIPDYQMAAWLMAVSLRGMGKSETIALTRAMMSSGQVLDLSRIKGVKVDKHSTGGVGDKVSLILAPLVAACGCVVPMVSGRSLAHTGGTLDKLESIPGFRTNLSLKEFETVLARVGVAIIGQTDEVCPADKKLYALRDVTATVDSIPLIAASIMSKKLAEGIDGLVLDVKTGSGAFMPRKRQARQLANLMIEIGTAMNKRVVALITNMSQPLGKMVGNALEVQEAIAALKNEGPPDLMEVTLTLGEEMLLIASIAQNRQQARRLLLRALVTGKALKKLQEMIAAQGGNPDVVDRPELMPLAKYKKEVWADGSGFIRAIATRDVGLLGIEIGLGRKRVEDRVDPGAGFVFFKKVGDRVKKGELLAEVYAGDEKKAEMVGAKLGRCFFYSEKEPKPEEMIIERLAPDSGKKGAKRRHHRRKPLQ